MGRNGQRKILAVIIILILPLHLIVGQTQKKIAPIKKKTFKVKSVTADSSKNTSEDIHLQSIDIEKVRRENVNPGKKPPGKVSKSLLMTENPLKYNSGASVSLYTNKTYSFTKNAAQLNSYVKPFAGNFGTLGLQAGMVISDISDLEIGADIFHTDGHIENAGENRGGGFFNFPHKSGNIVGLGIEGHYADNFNNDKNIVIKTNWDLSAAISKEWFVNGINNESDLYGKYYELKDFDNDYERKETIFGIKNSSSWNISETFTSDGQLLLAYQQLNYLDQESGDAQIHFELNGNYSFFENLSASLGFEIFRFNWAASDSFTIIKKQISDLYPKIGISYDMGIGIIQAKYEPTIEFGVNHTNMYSYANFAVAESRFQVMPATDRFIFALNGISGRFKFDIQIGREKREFQPYLTASKQIAYWNFGVNTMRNFSDIHFEFNSEKNFLISTELFYQDFYDWKEIKYIPFQPKWKWSFSFDKWFFENFTAKAGFKYYTPQYLSTEGDQRTKDQLNVILGASYSPINKLNFEITANNILGQEIWVAPNFRLPKLYLEISIQYRF